MAQLFRPSNVIFIKFALLIALAVVVILTVAVKKLTDRPDRLLSVAQPIPFSHKHHVGDDGIQCVYCHSSVEQSAFAGLPATHVCLTCHSQLYTDAEVLAPLHVSARTATPIRWNRVHDLPDFVYFDHSIHIAKGVGCVSCHGRIDQMPLTLRKHSLDMQWCLACHRQPQTALRPKSEVFSMTWNNTLSKTERMRLVASYHLQRPWRMTSCSTCHR